MVPIQLPIGEEKAFRGVVDLVSRKAFVFAGDGSGAGSEAPIPAEMAAEVQSARDALIEMVAENDEKLMEHFFEAGTLTDEELTSGLRGATLAGKLFPLVCTSAVANVGVPQLLDAIVDCLPSPVDRPFVGQDAAGVEVPCAADDQRPLSVRHGRPLPTCLPDASLRFASCGTTCSVDSTVHNRSKLMCRSGSDTWCCCRGKPRSTSRRSRQAIWARSPSLWTP